MCISYVQLICTFCMYRFEKKEVAKKEGIGAQVAKRGTWFR